MPTFGEFIAQAGTYAFRRRVVRAEHHASTQDTIVYLWRDPEHFVELPQVPTSQRLPRELVTGLCHALGIPEEDFGLGPEGVRERASVWAAG